MYAACIDCTLTRSPPDSPHSSLATEGRRRAHVSASSCSRRSGLRVIVPRDTTEELVCPEPVEGRAKTNLRFNQFSARDLPALGSAR
jgi:hypothetical protein